MPVKNAEVLSISSNGEMAALLAPRQLSDVGAADWSPDGKDLAVARSVAGRDRVEFPIGAVVYESPGVVGALRVSRDGKWIAAFEYKGDSSRVIAIRRADRAVRVLSQGWKVFSVGLAWSICRERSTGSTSRRDKARSGKS